MENIKESLIQNKDIEEKNICYCCEKKINTKAINIRSKSLCKSCADTYFKNMNKIIDTIRRQY